MNAGRRSKRSRLLALASAASLLLSSAYFIAAPVLARDGEVAGENEGENAALNIRKVDEEGKRLAGAVFTVDGFPGTYTTGADGHFCITGLPNDSQWTVTEIEAPAGYEIAEPASQLVEVDDDGDCNSPDGVFVNTIATPTPAGSEDESPSQTSPAASPRDSVLGGNPTPAGQAGGPSDPQLPDTATDDTTAPILAAVLAAIALASLGALTYLRLAEARHRR